MASSRGRDAIKSALVVTCLFYLETPGLKIHTGKHHWGDQEQEAHYINRDVMEKWLSTPKAPAKVKNMQ